MSIVLGGTSVPSKYGSDSNISFRTRLPTKEQIEDMTQHNRLR